MKKIGFLSFGHWSQSPSSQVRSASDALMQSLELAVAAEEVGADGAYYRVHHFARQLGSPFPLLAAVGARTSRIEIGTAVIDMRYENPFYMAEDAGAADLLAGGRLQLGISGVARAGNRRVALLRPPAGGGRDRRRHGTAPRRAVPRAARGRGFAQPNPRPMFPNPPGLLPIEPHSPGLRERIWWGAASATTASWAAALGMNLMSSTLVNDDATGDPFHVVQARHIHAFREAWREAGHERESRVSVSRSIFALVNETDRAYFGRRNDDGDHVGYIDENTRAIFGRTYAAEPDALVAQLAEDEAIAAADTLLLTVPNQLGVEYNAHVIESVSKYVAPELGWR